MASNAELTVPGSADPAPGGAHDAMFNLVVKALGTGDADVGASNLRAREEEQFTELGALPNPYPPEMLVRLFERSSALRPCVDAITTNVHGFGHRLVARLNLDAPEANAKIAEVILAERLYAGDDDPDPPTDEEVALRRAQIARGMERERLRLEVFFENCTREGFLELRRRLSNDLEITGNAYMEVRRDRRGRVARLDYAPATNMRLQKLEREPRVVERTIRISPITLETEQDTHQFRGYIQIVNGYTTYFKEFGDTRVMSAQSGRFYERVEDMPGTDTPASEIVHFRIFSSRTSYGIARWIGAAFEVLGIRAASEVNYLYFDNKGVPPLAIMVSGGALSDGSATAIEKFIEARMKGRANFHSVMVLEALPAAGSDPAAAGRVRIALQPLTDAQQRDGLFMEYSSEAEETVGRQFRLPPLIRGRTRDMNRATADAALRYAEQQVFQPERGAFDEHFDRTILIDLGVRYWRMDSNSPLASDPEALTKILDTLLNRGALTPAEARPFVNDVLNADLPKITAPWGQQPPAFTLAGLPLETPPYEAPKPGTAPAPGATPGTDLTGVAGKLVALRDQLLGRTREEQEAAFNKALDEARAAEGEVETIYVEPELMQKWVKPYPAPSAQAAPRGAVVDNRDDTDDD